METFIRQLCALSIFCGAALSLAPEGGARRAMSFVCSVVLLSFVLGGVDRLDWDAYALETTLLRERERSFLEAFDEARDELDRRVIEGECRDYVMEQARLLGLPLTDCAVTLEWSMEGVWLPHAVKLRGPGDTPEAYRLSRILETELGIPESRQEWIEDA